MKVKFEVNGQTFEKEIDDSSPVTINMTSGPEQGISFGESEQSNDPHREVVRFTKSTNFLGTTFDEWERTIIRDDQGNVVSVTDRNLSEEFRKEQRKLDAFKKQQEKAEIQKRNADAIKSIQWFLVPILLFIITLSLVYILMALFAPETLADFFEWLGR